MKKRRNTRLRNDYLRPKSIDVDQSHNESTLQSPSRRWPRGRGDSLNRATIDSCRPSQGGECCGVQCPRVAIETIAPLVSFRPLSGRKREKPLRFVHGQRSLSHFFSLSSFSKISELTVSAVPWRTPFGILSVSVMSVHCTPSLLSAAPKWPSR